MPTRSPIVVRPTTRGDFTARYPDAMVAGRGDTAEAALDDFCRFKNLDRSRLVESPPPDSPPGTRLYRPALDADADGVE